MLYDRQPIQYTASPCITKAVPAKSKLFRRHFAFLVVSHAFTFVSLFIQIAVREIWDASVKLLFRCLWACLPSLPNLNLSKVFVS
jgi:hypothetical protein